MVAIHKASKWIAVHNEETYQIIHIKRVAILDSHEIYQPRFHIMKSEPFLISWIAAINKTNTFMNNEYRKPLLSALCVWNHIFCVMNIEPYILYSYTIRRINNFF